MLANGATLANVQTRAIADICRAMGLFSDTMTERRRLHTWKEIGEFLGCNARTAARWEKERGLPVHHLPGGVSRSVYAFTDELDAWLARGGAGEAPAALSPVATVPDAPGPVHTSRASRWPILAVATLLILFGWITWTVTRAPFVLDVIRLQGHAVVAVTPNGKLAWSFTPPFAPQEPPPALRWSDVGDLDGRPGDEVVAGVLGSWEAPDVLYAFSNRGDVLWQRTLDVSVTFNGEEYGPPWRSFAVERFEIDGQPRLAWTVHHHTWWPSMVVLLDGNGQVLDRFVHAGWLSTMVWTGRHLVAAGTAASPPAYAVAVLDPRRPGGSAPPVEGRAVCDDCPAGRPLRYFRLARSELATIVDAAWYPSHRPPQLTVLPGGGLEFRVKQPPGLSGDAEAIYEFDADLTLRRAAVSDSYWTWHRELEKAGRVDHPADHCPDRDGLVAREWTAAGGWRDVGQVGRVGR